MLPLNLPPKTLNLTLRVQVPHNHNILTQNLYQNYYDPNPKYPIVGYMDPLGYILRAMSEPRVGGYVMSAVGGGFATAILRFEGAQGYILVFLFFLGLGFRV